MAKWPDKALVIGLDAAVGRRVYEMAEAGELPNIARLIKNGVKANNCLVPYPTITPPNWTSVATGAWPGTHGITDFNHYVPGDPLNVTVQAFDSELVQAEYIWEAAERAGKKTIVVNYPTTWPPRMHEGYQIGGSGLTLNEWRKGDHSFVYHCSLADEQLFTVEEYPESSVIEFEKARDWQGIPAGAKAKAAALPMNFRRAREISPDSWEGLPVVQLEPVTWQLLILDTDGKGFGEALICEEKDVSTAIARLKVGEWSPIIKRPFASEEGPQKAGFRMKLLELSPEADFFRLYLTPICALEGWSFPESMAGEIDCADGLPLPQGGFVALSLEWIDRQTFLEILDMLHNWLADASTYLMRHKDWDLYFLHIHSTDFAYHAFSNMIDPKFSAGPEESRAYREVELEIHRQIDRLVGELLDAAGERALAIVVSDHGAKVTTGSFHPNQALMDAGLLQLKQPPDERPFHAGFMERTEIDWSRTRAVPQRACYVYVNLKGRDPDGIVEPGEEYEQVREQIIDALLTYRDPMTGKRPVAMALRREDGRFFGLHGDRVGDVIFALSPEFGGQHGPFLPTVDYGDWSLKAVFVMAGPGVKEDYVLERTVMLPDIVPTICHLLDLPVPRDCEGAILYQALEDPNGKLKELQQLQRNYQRLKNAYERGQNLTHTYNG